MRIINHKKFSPFKFGNHKLGKDTIITNMSSATNCPSKKLGLCPIYNYSYSIENKNIIITRCYALKAEQQYKEHVLKARREQEEYWNTRSVDDILNDMRKKIESRKSETKYFRYNESGDFKNQEDIEKLSEIAKKLNEEFSITTYGYSARSDLDFKNVNFLVKGSGHDNGNNGTTIVVNKKEDVPKDYITCIGSCIDCDVCKKLNKLNVAFIKH